MPIGPAIDWPPSMLYAVKRRETQSPMPPQIQTEAPTSISISTSSPFLARTPTSHTPLSLPKSFSHGISFTPNFLYLLIEIPWLGAFPLIRHPESQATTQDKTHVNTRPSHLRQSTSSIIPFPTQPIYPQYAPSPHPHHPTSFFLHHFHPHPFSSPSNLQQPYPHFPPSLNLLHPPQFVVYHQTQLFHSARPTTLCW